LFFLFLFCSTDPNINIPQPADWNKYLGHDKRWKEGGPETVGYSDVGVFRDVTSVPPMSNIMVSGNSVEKQKY